MTGSLGSQYAVLDTAVLGRIVMVDGLRIRTLAGIKNPEFPIGAWRASCCASIRNSNAHVRLHHSGE